MHIIYCFGLKVRYIIHVAIIISNDPILWSFKFPEHTRLDSLWPSFSTGNFAAHNLHI